MLIHPLLITFSLFLVVHICIWFSTNSQFTNINLLKDNALIVAIALSIPISVMGLYASKFGYQAMESVWSVRFIAFGTSYLVFPILTWLLLGESMFHTKTIICTLLSFAILLIQLYE